MVSCKISCQIVSKCLIKSSVFWDDYNHLLITPKMYSMREIRRPGWPKKFKSTWKTIHRRRYRGPDNIVLKSKSRVSQKGLERNQVHNVIIVKLCCHSARNDYMLSPAIKGDDTSTKTPCCGAVCLAIIRAGFLLLCRGDPDKTRLLLPSRHSRKRDLVTKEFASQVSAITSWSGTTPH